MNLDEIEKQGFILALFVRDDGQRFLLGTGAYEFKEDQLHFAANTMTNDVVEVQGNDGYMLAGQVRRPTTQVFDGYIGDASINRAEVENYRRDFFAFFQKNHFYTVVYIFPNGSAIQRRRGFIVDCGEVKELYQLFPEYHIGMNFEDVNYYKYNEDSEGHEIYGKSAIVGLSTDMVGGLVWDTPSQNYISKVGTNLTFNNSVAAEFNNLEVLGDSFQQTYTGKNLYPNSQDFGGDGWNNSQHWTTSTETYNGLVVKQRSGAWMGLSKTLTVNAGETYTFSLYAKAATARAATIYLSGGTATISPQWESVDLTTEWQRFDLTFTASVTGTIYPRLELRADFDTPAYVCGYQMEKSSSMTSYEPYVGGTASPNPNYPQTVHTVSGEQTITISDGGTNSATYNIDLFGKNVLDASKASGDLGISTSYNSQTGELTYSGTTQAAWSNLIPTINNSYDLPAGTYTFSIDHALPHTITIRPGYDGGSSGDKTIAVGNTSVTFTTTNPTTKILVFIAGFSAGTSINETVKLQLESGSTPTTFSKYSPIELCKIGTYQDYIYKSGDDWYIHKDLGKGVFDGTENWQYPSSGASYTYFQLYYSNFVSKFGARFINALNPANSIMSDRFLCITTPATSEGMSIYGDWFRITVPNSIATTVSDFGTWLSSHNTTFYYALETPTDTQITDSTLIGQLDAIVSGGSYDGNTIITVSGNLASPLEIQAECIVDGGVEWDAYGAEWEAGGGGIANISVDSIENVFPVWVVTGPANNPTLENLTTGTTIEYAGNVTASQTLVVDMLNETAKLNGTSVIGNISGSWLSFAPGNNRVSYTATNSTAPDSTIEWQEIVG